MLISFKTYLLYRTSIFLETSESFKAMNYLLDTIRGQISNKFFEISICFNQNLIEDCNQIVTKYINLGFDQANLDVYESSFFYKNLG